VLHFGVLPLLALALQQPTELPPSPVKRIEVRPSTRTITAGDSVQLDVRALDANGAPVPGAVLYAKMLGGEGEGTIRPESFWLVASSVGKFPLAFSALVPGTLPFVDTTSVEFDGIPGPAVRVEVNPSAVTIVDGQSLRLSALPFSKANDRTLDSVRWRSSDPKVVAVDPAGLIIGLATGHARLTASVGGAKGGVDVRVVPSTFSRLTLKPARPAVRQGDVVSFAVEARDGAGKVVGDLTPTWSFSPGDGELGPDGHFVAYRADAYTVTATLGRRSASTIVTVRERDVRRSVTVVGRLPRTGFATS